MAVITSYDPKTSDINFAEVGGDHPFHSSFFQKCSLVLTKKFSPSVHCLTSNLHITSHINGRQVSGFGYKARNCKLFPFSWASCRF